MKFTLRPYQEVAVGAGVEHFRTGYGNAYIVCPTGGGKSLIIASIADKLDGKTLVFQPSREILMQNYQKMRSFGHNPAIFSASAGKKQIANITFATIGSAINKKELFEDFSYIIVDECHLTPPESEAMYNRFLTGVKWRHGQPKLLGLTATPYRLKTNRMGARICMLERMRPRVWDRMIYHKQIGDLAAEGFLAKMEYFRTNGIDPATLRLNSSGSDYTDASIRAAWQASDMEAKVVNIVQRLLSGEKSPARKGVLVFTKFVEEARNIASFIPGAEWVSGETPSDERKRILDGFTAGQIPVVVNVAVLDVGFDHPALDTVVLASPTLSLAKYYQRVGRAMRPHPSKKSAWIIDMVGLVNRFGYVEDLTIGRDYKGLSQITSRGRKLTNTVIEPKVV